MRLILKIGSYRILCPDKYSLDMAIHFASKMVMVREQSTWNKPVKFVASPDEEIRYELVPDESLDIITEIKEPEFNGFPLSSYKIKKFADGGVFCPMQCDSH